MMSKWCHGLQLTNSNSLDLPYNTQQALIYFDKNFLKNYLNFVTYQQYIFDWFQLACLIDIFWYFLICSFQLIHFSIFATFFGKSLGRLGAIHKWRHRINTKFQTPLHPMSPLVTFFIIPSPTYVTWQIVTNIFLDKGP